MAGFMAGFGEAFSKSYEKARDRTEQRERDDMEYQFRSYMQDREKYLSKREEEEKALEAASAFVPDGDPGKIEHVARWIKSGVDPKIIQQNLNEYNFVPLTETGPETPATSGDMLDPQVKAPKAPVEEQADELLGPVSDSPMKPVQRVLNPQAGVNRNKQDKIVQRLSRITGDDEKDVAEILGGIPTQDKSGLLKYRLVPKSTTVAKKIKDIDYEHLDAELMKAQAEGDMDLYKHLKEVYIAQQKLDNDLNRNGGQQPFEPMVMFAPDKDGKMRKIGNVSWNGAYVRMPGQEGDVALSTLDAKTIFISPKDVDTLVSRLNTEIAPTQERAEGVSQFAINLAYADKILSENPYAGSGVASTVGAAKSILFEIDAMRSLLETAAEAGYSIDGMSMEDAEETLVGMLNNSGVGEMSKGAQHLANIQIEMTFDFMRAKGQTGNAVSVKEFEAAYKSLFESKRQEDLIPHLRGLLQRNMTMYSLVHNKTQKSISSEAIGGTYWFNGSPDEYIKELLPEGYFDFALKGVGPNPLEGQSILGLDTPPMSTNKAGPVQIKTVEEYNNLPDGTVYIDPTGKTRTKGSQ